jgi:4-amino-4-deoxy-L-arabinose transferase-like glycosyltransferase
MWKKPQLRYLLVTAGFLAIFLTVTLASARTRAPWEDESWFGSATYNLLTQGRLATNLIEGAGTWRAGTVQHLYWEPPLSFVANALFCKISGFSLFALRGASILWGFVALASCALLVWKLTGRARAAVIALFLVSVDYFFLLGSSEARMDVMCFALGFAGLTSYLVLRERSLAAALFVSQAFVVMSGATHPNGILWFACVAATVLICDRKRLALRPLAWAAVPYLIGAIGWGIFIGADPHDFVTQFIGNMKESSASNGLYRSPLSAPAAGFIVEVRERYLGPYGLLGGMGGLNRLKAIVLVIYLSGIVIAMTVSSVRSQPPIRFLLIIMLIVFLYLAFVTGNKWYRYLIHLTPLWAMLLAVLLDRALERQTYARAAALAVLLVMAVVQWGGLLYRIRQNPYTREYLPVSRFIEQNSSPASFIIGPAGFYWTLWGKRQFVNDLRLGYVTGKSADVIIINDWYRSVLLDATGDIAPVRDYARRLLSEKYTPQWVHGEYTVYLGKSTQSIVVPANSSIIEVPALGGSSK